jgi:hypothetical protein
LGAGHLRPRAALLAAMLVAACATATASAATPADLSQRAAAMADAISVDWSRSLSPSGLIVDPFSHEPEGGYGRTFLAYGMLRAEQRNPSLDLNGVIAHALQNPGAVAQAPFNLLALAEILLNARGALEPALTASLAQLVLSYPSYGSTSPTAPCARRVGCYDNLKLVNASALLGGIAALPGTTGTPRSTFASPSAATGQVRRLLAITVPRVASPSAELRVGKVRLAGATLSDPTRDPPAYLALSTMMLGRALELDVSPPASAVRAFQRAIVALLGLTAPDGNISYMGRGQGQVWTMATAAAGCALAMRLLPSQHFIDSRCEGLIDVELNALDARRSFGGVGIAVVPRLTWTRGVDNYVNRTDYNGLTVYALNLASDALTGLHDPGEQPIPGAETGETFSDPWGSGLATTDLAGVWFVVHERDTNSADSRWGFGLMAMERRTSSRWTSELADRPLGPEAQGPTLFLNGRDYEPVGGSVQVEPGRIVVRGGWGVGSRLLRPVTFSYQATKQGVELAVPVDRGDSLIVNEWILLRRPTTTSLVSPSHQVRRVARIPLGNDTSDDLDQVNYRIARPRAGLIRVAWIG